MTFTSRIKYITNLPWIYSNQCGTTHKVFGVVLTTAYRVLGDVITNVRLHIEHLELCYCA